MTKPNKSQQVDLDRLEPKTLEEALQVIQHLRREKYKLHMEINSLNRLRGAW